MYEENNNFETSDDEGTAKKAKPEFEKYDPTQAYNYERAHTEPEIGPGNHPVPPSPQKPNSLALAGFVASLAAYFLCCCNPYVGIAVAILGLTLSICSRFFGNDERRMSGFAVAGIILSIIALILVIGSILITYVLVPYLMETSPEFKEYYNNVYRMLEEMLQRNLEQGTSASQ